MKTIWKYPLEITNLQTVKLPMGAEILVIQLQQGCPCLWAMVDSDDKIEPREIEILGTGHPVPVADRRYIGTVQMNSGSLVWHVFERIK